MPSLVALFINLSLNILSSFKLAAILFCSLEPAARHRIAFPFLFSSLGQRCQQLLVTFSHDLPLIGFIVPGGTAHHVCPFFRVLKEVKECLSKTLGFERIAEYNRPRLEH